MFDYKSSISFYRPLSDSISFRSGKVAKLAIKYVGKGKNFKSAFEDRLHLLLEKCRRPCSDFCSSEVESGAEFG
jgi:hypothetical protein